MFPERPLLLDTSIFIADETGRTMARALPGEAAISVVTLGEFALGVLAAGDQTTRARRLETLSFAERSYAPLGIDGGVARAWAHVTARARAEGRRAPVNDCWIAATALVHGRAILTQDRDYEGFDVEVLRI